MRKRRERRRNKSSSRWMQRTNNKLLFFYYKYINILLWLNSGSLLSQINTLWDKLPKEEDMKSSSHSSVNEPTMLISSKDLDSCTSSDSMLSEHPTGEKLFNPMTNGTAFKSITLPIHQKFEKLNLTHA